MSDFNRRSALIASAVGGVFATGAFGAASGATGCCGSGAPDTGVGGTPLPFYPRSVFQEFSNRAGPRITKFSNRFSFRGDDMPKVGVLQTPSGKLLYGSLVVTDDAGAAYTEVGKYQIVVEIQFGDVQKYRAALIEDGDELVRATWNADASPGGATAINGGGVIRDLDVDLNDDDLAATRSCFENCIRRHAPNCVYICLNFGKEACIACAGGVVACCFINCHC